MFGMLYTTPSKKSRTPVENVEVSIAFFGVCNITIQGLCGKGFLHRSVYINNYRGTLVPGNHYTVLTFNAPESLFVYMYFCTIYFLWYVADANFCVIVFFCRV